MAARCPTLFNALKVSPVPSYRRTMATAPKTFEFIALIPDKPGARERRLSVRAQHFKELSSKTETGAWKMGGAILRSVPESDDPTAFDFEGSAVISVAESKEQVIEQLKTDIYHTAGVWDTEKAQIIPYLNGYRTS